MNSLISVSGRFIFLPGCRDPKRTGIIGFFPHQICPDALELLGRTFSAVQLSSSPGLPAWKMGSKAWMSLSLGENDICVTQTGVEVGYFPGMDHFICGNIKVPFKNV